MTRSRLLVPLLALALATSATPAVAQSDDGSRSLGDILADAVEELAREIESAQDEIADLADDIDATDPDAPLDPLDPAGEPVDPTDPESLPGGDPSTPEATDPDDIAPPELGIEHPETPDEEEEGGFHEIQLLPDRVSAAGKWQVTHKRGLVSCRKLGNTALPRTTQSGRITVGTKRACSSAAASSRDRTR